MLWEILFWTGLVVYGAIGFHYFRELGDISQMFFRIRRHNLVRVIRHEYKFVAAGCVAATVMAYAHVLQDAGPAWAFWIAVATFMLFYVFTYVWLHVGMRTASRNAKYCSIEEARSFVSPSNSVLVIENKGIARAHPDGQMLRPHVAGNAKGFGGEDVVMTYCGMSNLGLGYKPEIEGQAVDLEVMAQIGNNLILRDNFSGEPVQQIWGKREREVDESVGMQPWPTFRMSFRGFQRAYPSGVVFLNPSPGNWLLRVIDTAQDMMFTWGITNQHRVEAPVIDNMTNSDDRLPNKTLVWGINLDDDSVCYTDDFLIQEEKPVNATVGGRAVVLAHDRKFESIGIWYNDSGQQIAEVDFFGMSDRGQLRRVEMVKPGMFWHVWVEFFPHTDINRVDGNSLAAG